MELMSQIVLLTGREALGKGWQTSNEKKEKCTMRRSQFVLFSQFLFLLS